jgi:hypothetical protein
MFLYNLKFLNSAYIVVSNNRGKVFVPNTKVALFSS